MLRRRELSFSPFWGLMTGYKEVYSTVWLLSFLPSQTNGLSTLHWPYSASDVHFFLSKVVFGRFSGTKACFRRNLVDCRCSSLQPKQQLPMLPLPTFSAWSWLFFCWSRRKSLMGVSTCDFMKQVLHMFTQYYYLIGTQSQTFSTDFLPLFKLEPEKRSFVSFTVYKY